MARRIRTKGPVFLLAAVGAALLLFSTAAVAAVSVGTDASETLTGTEEADQLTGKGGRDTTIGKGGSDTYFYQDMFGRNTLDDSAGELDTLDFSEYPYFVEAYLTIAEWGSNF